MFESHILKHWGKAPRPPYRWRKKVYFPQAGRLAEKFRHPFPKPTHTTLTTKPLASPLDIMNSVNYITDHLVVGGVGVAERQDGVILSTI